MEVDELILLLIILGIFTGVWLITQYSVVIILMLEGDYKSKRKFLKSLIPFYPAYKAVKKQWGKMGD